MTYKLIFVLFIILPIIGTLEYKDLAGPSEEFSNFTIPNPFNNSYINNDIIETKSFININNTNKYFTKSIIYVDTFNFTLFVISPLVTDFTFQFLNQNGTSIVYIKELTNFILGSGNSVTAVHIIPQIKETENHTLIITGDYLNNQKVIINYENNFKFNVQSYLSTYVISHKRNLTVFATIVDNNGISVSLITYKINKSFNNTVYIKKGTLDILNPDGTTSNVEMNDQGINGDITANDNIFSGTLSLNQQGAYTLFPLLLNYYNGIDDQYHFQRQGRHLINVSPSQIDLLPKVKLSKNILGIYEIILYVNTGNSNNITYNVYLELYGEDKCHKNIAVVWVGGLTHITKFKNEYVLIVELHPKWLKRVSVCSNLIIKNYHVIDINTSFVVDYLDGDIIIPFNYKSMCEYLDTINDVKEITTEMRYGIRTYNNSTYKKRQGDDHSILMLPGYCASSNPWEPHKDIFTRGVFFNQFNLAKSNQDYAFRVLDFISDIRGIEDYTIIAHSQGGMVALHIKNYFHSGLDNIDNVIFILIQSVGTPYQGTPLAGFTASIGNAFGVGCGPVSDLSPDGAVNWLSKITPLSFTNVNWYTSTYDDSSPIGHCNTLTEISLRGISDGITELEYAKPSKFSGNEGNIVGECHTTNMFYPASYNDNQRNIDMNNNA